MRRLCRALMATSPSTSETPERGGGGHSWVPEWILGRASDRADSKTHLT